MVACLLMLETAEDKSKFEKIYLRYRKMMYAVAYDILRNERDAEDAVQNAFLKIAENLEKIFDIECTKTKSYIVTIIENQAIDLYRRKKRHADVPFDEECAGMQMEYKGTNELAGCMARLPAHYREILLLRYSHGYGTEEIGRIMGVSPCYVSTLLQRAKKKLELLCKEEEIL